MEIRLTPLDLEPIISPQEGNSISVVFYKKINDDFEISLGGFYNTDTDNIRIKTQKEVFDIFISKILGVSLTQELKDALYESFLQNNGLKIEIN